MSIFDSYLDNEIQHRKDEMMAQELEKFLAHVVGKEQNEPSVPNWLYEPLQTLQKQLTYPIEED